MGFRALSISPLGKVAETYLGGALSAVESLFSSMDV
jgi:hypothetical protein